MSKALVIKNVNFSENALAQVTIVNPIPCTSISLDESISLTALTPVTLTATVAPVDTTDSVVWISSDNTVATVTDGVVTPLKGGSVTITAICGSQIATCAVTIRVFLDVGMLYTIWWGISTFDAGNAPRLEGGAETTTYGGCLNTTRTGGYYAYDPDGRLLPDRAYPVLLPDGTKRLKVTLPNQSIKTSISWVDKDEGIDSTRAPLVKAYDVKSVWNGTAGDRIITVPTDAGTINGFYLSAYLAGNTLTQAMLDEITVEALYTTE